MTDTPPPPAAPVAPAPLSVAEDKQWGSFAHLGGIIGILPSLIIWLVFKDRGPVVHREGKEALNFQIALVIVVAAYSVLNAILTVVTFGFWMLIGWLPYLAIWVLDIVWSIMGFSAVNAGGGYRYPISIRFIK